jgi:hypothetical protein
MKNTPTGDDYRNALAAIYHRLRPHAGIPDRDSPASLRADACAAYACARDILRTSGHGCFACAHRQRYTSVTGYEEADASLDLRFGWCPLRYRRNHEYDRDGELCTDDDVSLVRDDEGYDCADFYDAAEVD